MIDLGTGSGAIALAIKQARPDAAGARRSTRSADALAVARGKRPAAWRCRCEFRQARWLDGAPGRYDLIVSNPPYVAARRPAPARAARTSRCRRWRPGPDGLDDIRAIVAQAPAHLRRGGWLLLEHGHDQAAAVRALLAAAGFAGRGQPARPGGHRTLLRRQLA